MPRSTMSSKGQVTVPKEIRDKLRLRPGDRLIFTLDRKGNVLVRPETEPPLGRLAGLLKHLSPARPATIEEMRAGVRARARSKHRKGSHR